MTDEEKEFLQHELLSLRGDLEEIVDTINFIDSNIENIDNHLLEDD